MNDYAKSDISLDKKDALKICVFITSSTGDGESPENGKEFQRYLINLNSQKPL
jgi:sulfite reductase alpha subunit-like flavoprotein